MRLFKVCLAFVFCVSTTFADQLQGCSLDSTICDENEICLNDGLFGQCYSEGSGNTPLVIQKPLTAVQQNVLRFHLYQLAREDVNWPDASSQCVLSYFKLAVVYDLDYDVDFCKVRNPANVWALVQRVQAMLADSDGYLSDEELQTGQTQARSLTEEQLAALEGSEQAAEQAQISEPILETSALSPVEEVEAVEQEPLLKVAQQVLFVDPEDNVALPVVFLKDVSPEELMQELAAEEEETGEPVSVVIEADEHPNVNATNNNIAPADASDINEDQVAEIVDELAKEAQQEPKKRDLGSALELTNDEKNQLDDYVHDVLNTGNVGSKKLSPVQQNKIVELIGSLQQVLEQSQDISAPEIEEIVPLTSLNNEQQLLLKKDIEQYNNADMGLANVVHKIVKGDFHRLEGNRVYLRVAKEDITDEDLDKLIEFLDRKIAQPNDLYFDDFKYEDGQLSFRIVRLNDIKPSGDKRMDSASGVAQAVYKRRKDIQTLAGLQVDETGIGSGQETVPVEKSERDWMFMPILFVCSLTIMTLLSVLAANFYKNRKTPLNVALPQVFDQFDSKAASTYEDLCRQRMNTQDVAGTSGVNNNGGSKTSSTSSWPDDGFMQTCNLDVSTGHVILSFLKEHLENPGKIVDQWLSVSGYFNANAVTTIAQEPQNVHKNRDQSLIPYDESLAGIANGYINASKIHDSDPRHCAYILTQTPMEATIADYWQLVWEHGVSLLVNLCQLNEGERYWPSEGTEVYGSFEVNLVSEHIWSEDYVVRSFYLKLLKTGETRTVTQFHYLSWPKGSVPESNKSLLEFRRKVNKSYRGRSSPILVHDLDGTGRAGTYCLIDVVTNRINKGVKEIDIAASLEHIRDQRPYLVANSEQYNLVFSCVAEEVTSLIKAIQH